MKNLFLTVVMLLFATVANAQQTPTKQSKTSPDSTVHKSGTHKTDTVKSQHKNKAAKKTKSTNPAVNSNRKDTIKGVKTTPKNP